MGGGFWRGGLLVRGRRSALLASALVIGAGAAGTGIASAGAAGAGIASARAATARTVATAAPPAAPAVCADVLFAGARGSGEKGPGDRGWTPSRADPFGLGATVDSAYRRLMADLGGRRTVQVISVRYAANGVQTLTHAPNQYFSDLAAGVSWTMGKLAAQARSCPDQQVVLAGFSQGAMVMHRVLHDLGSTAANRAILARVAAAILVGDGDEVPNDNQVRFGTAARNARGIGQALRTLSHASAAKFSASVGPRVLSVCNAHDLVCGWTDFNLACLVVPWKCALSIATMVKIHLSYPGSKPLLAAADRAAGDVRAVPAPTPRTITLDATAGEPFRHQLTADVGAGYTLQWALAPRQVMPSGLALSPGGLISGVPKVTGSATTLIRVRSVRRGVYSIWVPATARLTIRANPGTWTVTSAPVPDNAMAGDGGSPAAVACPAPSWCVAVGNYTDSSGTGQALVASGPPAQPGAWAAAQAPAPGNASEADGAGLSSVACGSAAYCVAIGNYVPGSGNGSDGQLLVWSGTTWTAIQAPLPANAFRFTDAAVGVSLSSVACAAATTRCVVVGAYYVDAAGDQAPLIITGSGTTWTAVEGPLPAGAAPGTGTGLAAVSCASATFCAAVGARDPADPLVETGYGTSWQAADVNPPANQNTQGGSYGTDLTSVACASPSSCVAAGQYPEQQAGGVVMTGVLATGSGSAWNAAAAPLPANAGTLTGSPPPDLSSLTAIACAPGSRCVAAGGYATNTPGPGGSILYEGLLATGSGSAWVPAQAPVPAGANASYGAVITAVACLSATTCAGGGGYSDQAGNHLLLVTGSAAAWTAHAVPLPAGAAPHSGAGFAGISCASATSCVALGWYFTSGGNEQSVLVTGPGA